MAQMKLVLYFIIIFLNLSLFSGCDYIKEKKDILKEKIAQKACKAAIKSGKTLSQDEIECLLSMLKSNIALRCPHGRPITVKVSRTEIDKWFKRIV